MTDAPIRIAAYDRTWPERFEAERHRLTPVLAPWLAGDIEHVGSTAVPGLAAKPVIDCVAPVTDLVAARAVIPVLERLGYIYWAHDPHDAWRHWFLTPRIEARTHHLYLIERDEPEFTALLAFRDHLRAHPDDAAAYAALKRKLAARHTLDREGYTQAKTEFVAALFERIGKPLPHPRAPRR